jgi:BirA family transcriptional regulator, biotin operon repressor / biotin---[acetyl-CoA-carboxylase] ligase
MHPPENHVALPAGHRVLTLETVTSTNEVALKLARDGEPSGLWVTAARQEGGRGRGGRPWSSPPGNLYASHLLRPACALGTAQQLTLLAPVALFDAVAELTGHGKAASPKLRLKWPNDLLVDGAKVSGILLESVIGPALANGDLAIVLGFGLNLASHPPGLDQAATHLQAMGCAASPETALTTLARATQTWLERWSAGADFAGIRAAWLERAGALGETLSVRTSPDPSVPRISGAFAGLDEDGALLLDHTGGARSRHIQGDVALGALDR